MSSINFLKLLKAKYISKSRIKNYRKYIKLLSKHLNIIHKTNHSIKYWEIIVGPWLIHFIFFLDYRYKNLKNKKKIKSIRNYIVPYDYTAYAWFNNVKSDYTESLDDLIHSTLKNKIHNKKYSFKKLFLEKKNPIYNFLKKIVSKITEIFLPFAKIIIISPYFTFFNQLKMIVISGCNIFPIILQDNSTFIDSSKVKEDNRNWNNKRYKFEDTLDKLLFNIVLKQIPYVYIEGYSRNLSLLPKIYKNTKLLYSASAFQENEKVKLYAAELKEKNSTLIVGGQHGGSPYGTTLHPIIYHEMELADKYVTWGWKKSSHHIPLGNIQFSLRRKQMLKLRDNSKKKSYLFVSDAGQINWPDGTGVPSGDEWNKYFNDQKVLIKGLSKINTKRIMYRMHPHHKLYPFDQISKILNLRVSLDTNKNIYNSLVDARLVICDNLKTTFYEALVYDIPVILVLNLKIWKIDKNFAVLIKKMKSIGMFHDTTKSACSHLNNNTNNIEKWWNSKSVVSIKQEIINNYVKILDKPEKELSRLLINLSLNSKNGT